MWFKIKLSAKYLDLLSSATNESLLEPVSLFLLVKTNVENMQTHLIFKL